MNEVFKYFLIGTIVLVPSTILLIIKTRTDTYYIKVTHEVYLDIQIDGIDEGRIIIGLFGDDVPKTVKNFYTIATKGIGGRRYTNTRFHRIIPRYLIQGGDVIYNNGSGSISIYGTHFPDENFKFNHSGPGFVSMANAGPNTNGCQFFITTMETPSLNGHYVVFGKVVRGQALVHKIEHVKRDYYTEKPLVDVRIASSGKVFVEEPYFTSDHPYTFWHYMKAIVPPLSFSLSILAGFHWFMCKLDAACNI